MVQVHVSSTHDVGGAVVYVNARGLENITLPETYSMFNPSITNLLLGSYKNQTKPSPKLGQNISYQKASNATPQLYP